MIPTRTAMMMVNGHCGTERGSLRRKWRRAIQWDAAAKIVDELAGANAQRRLVAARAIDVTAEAKYFRSRRFRRADIVVPLRAALDNQRHVRQRCQL